MSEQTPHSLTPDEIHTTSGVKGGLSFTCSFLHSHWFALAPLDFSFVIFFVENQGFVDGRDRQKKLWVGKLGEGIAVWVVKGIMGIGRFRDVR